MTFSSVTLETPAPRLDNRVRLFGWLLAASGVAMAWPGGLLALTGAALIAVGVALALRTPYADGAVAEDPAAPAAATPRRTAQAGRQGAEVMVTEVVPVWSRQLEVTRDGAAEGLNNILELFSQISSALNALVEDIQAFNVTAEPGAVDQAVRRESPALEALLKASQRAFDQRDAAVAELARCADSLVDLHQLAKQTREIARHTRLVAFNASIEANRARSGSASQAGEGGSQAVAVELRTVASRMAEAGERVDRVVAALLGSIRQARRTGEIGDTTEDELRLEIDLRAREALTALLGSMGSALQGSQSANEASRALRQQLEEVFVHFQFGDRISQMLSIVANDMNNFTRWVQENPQATQADASTWLAALEASYTMDEQRSTHHGNVHVDKSAGVEFF